MGVNGEPSFGVDVTAGRYRPGMTKKHRQTSRRSNPHHGRITEPKNPSGWWPLAGIIEDGQLISQAIRTYCSACGGPIEWTTIEQVLPTHPELADVVQFFGTADLDVWHCLSPDCDECGAFERESHIL